MLKLDAAAFYVATKAINHARVSIDTWPDEDNPDRISPEAIVDETIAPTFIEKCEGLKEHLGVLEARIAEMATEDVIKKLKSPYRPTWRELSALFADIDRTIERELSLVNMRVIDRSRLRFYEPKEPLLGPDFQAKFKTDGIFELDEAGKCLALGRPTACVFHLMRVMEVGIKALARCLNIPDPTKPAQRNWGFVLGAISAGMDQKWPSSASRLSGDGALFEELLASLDAVKNPQRNATMHVEKKYTDDEAEEIFVGVRGFMKKLAARCDEDGKPPA